MDAFDYGAVSIVAFVIFANNDSRKKAFMDAP